MGTGTRRFSSTMIGIFLMAAFVPLGSPQRVAAVSPDLVISQVYGGGGNSGATYTHDYVEIFNRGSSAASLSGMSIQYASSAGTGFFGASTTQLTELPAVSLAPGQYYLVQEGAGTGNGIALPTPDLIDPTPIAMSGSAGKVALATGTTGLGCNGSSGQPCSAAALARIVDLVGYGTANFSEGSPAPALTNSTAALRAGGGCTDTDNNSADFTAVTPAARNTSSPLNACAGGDAAPTVVSTDPADSANGVAANTNIQITFSEPVNVSGGWFNISCGSGVHSATSSGGPTTFTLDPAASFGDLDLCTVTIVAAQVMDQDGNDPPDNMAADHVFSFTTAGNVCDDAFTPIYAIQGNGSAAAITGNLTTEGVVVGDFEGPTTAGIQGFYLQDATGDGDTATSDGIYVFTGNSDNAVSIGDVLRVTGFARERFNQTTINGSNSDGSAVPGGNIVNCGPAAVPAAVNVSLPMASSTSLERYEGMHVNFDQQLVIAEYFNYERFGELVLALPLAGEDRPFTPTALEEPGSAGYFARAAANTLSRITLDDGLGSQNPPSIRHPNGAAFSLSNRFRGGDIVQNAVGVLGFDFSLYRIQPTGSAQYTPVNGRPASPTPVGGNATVAAMNTLNFFITGDESGGPLDNKCGPSQSMECRGHDTNQPDEFTRQRDKLIAALAGLNTDVIGLNEIENTTGVDPLGGPNGIVAGLNAVLGAGTYAAINTGTIGTDAIRVGLIYKPGAVTPIGGFETLDSADDPRFIDTKSRPALAQTFMDNSTGGVFTVAVNHLKSKGSACDDVGDPDTGDGSGNCNGTRTLAAQALVDWLAGDPTGSGDPDFLIIGDLNSYAMEDPIDAIKAGPDDIAGTADDYTNLIEHFLGEHAYSYVFDGQVGYLDHALASASLTAQVTGAAEWHINADEPDVLDYDTSFKPPAQDALYEPNAFRSSDHDPVIVGLDVCDTIAPTLTLSASPNSIWPPNHKYVNVTVTANAADNFDANPTVTLLSVTSNEPDNGLGDGDTANDIVIVGTFNVKLRAERSGTGNGRIYTLTYQVTDSCGNATTQTVTVTVPKSR